MVTATPVTSGLFGNTYSTVDGGNPKSTILERVFRRRSMAITNELLLTLIGATSGGTAAKNISRVTAVQQLGLGDNGGQVAIEAEAVINRATTAADITALNLLLTESRAPTTYPVDGSNNGVTMDTTFTP